MSFHDRRVRTSLIVLCGVVLVVVAIVVDGATHSAVPRRTASYRHRPVTNTTTIPAPPPTVPVPLVRPGGPNLIDNPDLTGAPVAGLAPGLLAWGVRPHFSVVSVPVHTLPARLRPARPAPGREVRAQRESIGERVGGAWYTVIVHPDDLYLEQLALDVPALAAGARIDVNLEWYAIGHEGNLVPLGAVAQHRWSPTHSFVEISQASVAPPGSRQAHIVVNVVGGGTAVFTDVSLRLAVRR